MSMLTINAIFKRHKQEYPNSLLSMHVIRKAVSEGELKSISSGSKRLINWDAFNKWLGYENQYMDKLMDSFESGNGLSDKEKDVLIKLLIEKMEMGR